MKGRILVIDDLVYDVKALRTILEHDGYQVTAAGTGREGLRLAREEDPDAILLDVALPDTDGFEVCRRLKEDPRTDSIPVVFLTAHYQDEESMIRGLNLGANDYICKPFNKAELLARVAVMVRIRRSEESLLRLSLTDELTGLGNRRFLLTRLEEEYERCRRSGCFLACLMLDLDHFKAVNDAYGHPLGDEVLREMAGLLREQTRKADVLSRYGGEEFVVLLAVKWQGESELIAERIRRAAEKFPFGATGGAGPLRVTVSLGVSDCLPAEQGAADPRELIGRADEALYEAKRTGRNRVCRWAGGGPVAVRFEGLDEFSA
jgi:two-component system cell cycle response regulator